MDTAPALYLCTGRQKVYPAAKLSRPTAGPHRCMSTAMSTTEQELHLRLLSLNDGHEHPASVVAHQRACKQQRPNFNELQLWELDCLLTACTRGICLTCTNLVNGLQLGNNDGPTNSPDHGTSLCATTGKSAHLQTRGIDHHVQEQLENYYGLLNS